MPASLTVIQYTIVEISEFLGQLLVDNDEDDDDDNVDDNNDDDDDDNDDDDDEKSQLDPNIASLRSELKLHV